MNYTWTPETDDQPASVGMVCRWGGFVVADISDGVPEDERDEYAEKIANLLNRSDGNSSFTITKELIDHCASRLVSYDTKANGEESVWPDDYHWADVAAARKDAEKVLRAANSYTQEDK